MATSSQSRPLQYQQALPIATYYFAYGSNLHLSQMSRRCPSSRFIGRALLPNYRWHINQRGYANVRPAEGYCVQGLVYQVDDTDEASLDVYEGVSSNAYSKSHVRLLLHPAHAALYRRPVAWIVDHGGPAQIRRLATGETEPPPISASGVLVYLNLSLTRDSEPREEYVKRINLGIADARALGIDEEYIRSCLRPFIPEPVMLSPAQSSPHVGRTKGVSPRRGRKVATPSQSSDFAPAPKKRTLSLPPEKKGASRSTSRGRSKTTAQRVKESTQSNGPQTPLQVQVDSFQRIPVIVVEEETGTSSRRRWPLSR